MELRQLPRSRQDGVVTLDEHEQQQLTTALAAIPAEVRAFALEVAMIDLEQEPAARALVVGELRRLSEWGMWAGR